MSQADIDPGTELVLVYIGSSDCGPSNLPETREAVRKAKRALAKRTRGEDNNLT